MNEVLKKKGVRSGHITITPQTKQQIQLFKDRLIDIANRPDETSEFDVRTVDIIFNELDDYDRNLLIAYYAIADCNTNALAQILCCGPQVVFRRIKMIQNKIRTLNDTPKHPRNQPRTNPCD